MSAYKIVLPPEFALNAQTFAQLWNADQAAQTIAAAQVEVAQPQGFELSPEMMIALGFIGSVAGTVVTTAVQDITKRLIAQWWDTQQPEQTAPPYEIVEKTLADGTTLLVVVPKSD